MSRVASRGEAVGGAGRRLGAASGLVLEAIGSPAQPGGWATKGNDLKTQPGLLRRNRTMEKKLAVPSSRKRASAHSQEWLCHWKNARRRNT